MKKLISLTIAVVLLAVSFTSVAQKDKKKQVRGSGNVITKDFPVQSFDALDANGVFNVVLSQDGKESVKIEADDNLMELFEVKTEGSTLKVTMKEDVNLEKSSKMKVYISFKTLKKMDLQMVGNLTSSGSLNFNDLSLNNSSVGSVELDFAAQKLDLDNRSVGSLKLKGKADNAVIKNSGVGSLKAGDFVVQTMDIDNHGIGSAEVNAAKELKINDSFLGKVKNVGSAPVKKSQRKTI